jgi:fatty acid desaturase
MAGEVFWPKMSAALDEQRAILTTADHAAVRTRATATTTLGVIVATAAILAAFFIPHLADWPTWAFYVAVLVVALPVGVGTRLLANAEDAKAARRVHELAARRRLEREQARTTGALGAGGDSVAVPGIVDDRVREARR